MVKSTNINLPYGNSKGNIHTFYHWKKQKKKEEDKLRNKIDKLLDSLNLVKSNIRTPYMETHIMNISNILNGEIKSTCGCSNQRMNVMV